jgi:hypothetical protein
MPHEAALTSLNFFSLVNYLGQAENLSHFLRLDGKEKSGRWDGWFGETRAGIGGGRRRWFLCDIVQARNDQYW